jgi:hypothetical protein
MMMVAGFYFHPAEKSSFFVIYFRCVTLADKTGQRPYGWLVLGINTTTIWERK